MFRANKLGWNGDHRDELAQLLVAFNKQHIEDLSANARSLQRAITLKKNEPS